MNVCKSHQFRLLFIVAAALLSSCSALKRTAAPQPVVFNSPIPDAPGKTLVINNVPVKPVLQHRPPYLMVPAADSIAKKYATILELKKADIQNGRLYDFIDHWMGTPYRFGGLARDGVDCSGFVYLLQQQVYDIADMPRSTNLQINYINQKPENELKEGDLVFFDFDGKPFSHVGIYLQNGYVVHASTSKGVIIIKLHAPSLLKYFSRAGSVIDPADLPQQVDGN
ncbi:MAG: C40 family peptidase [Mucilaginibacter sp.]